MQVQALCTCVEPTTYRMAVSATRMVLALVAMYSSSWKFCHKKAVSVVDGGRNCRRHARCHNKKGPW